MKEETLTTCRYLRKIETLDRGGLSRFPRPDYSVFVVMINNSPDMRYPCNRGKLMFNFMNLPKFRVTAWLEHVLTSLALAGMEPGSAQRILLDT